MASLDGAFGSGPAEQSSKRHGRALDDLGSLGAGILAGKRHGRALGPAPLGETGILEGRTPYNAKNASLGSDPAERSSKLHGRFLPVDMAGLGEGSGRILSTLTPSNLEPASDIRRYTVIKFNVAAPNLDGLILVFQHGDATEICLLDGTFQAPYLRSVVVPIAGGFHFQIRRTLGWLFPPGLTVYRFTT